MGAQCTSLRSGFRVPGYTDLDPKFDFPKTEQEYRKMDPLGGICCGLPLSIRVLARFEMQGPNLLRSDL